MRGRSSSPGRHKVGREEGRGCITEGLGLQPRPHLHLRLPPPSPPGHHVVGREEGEGPRGDQTAALTSLTIMLSNSELCAIMDSTSPSPMCGLSRELKVTMLRCL